MTGAVALPLTEPSLRFEASGDAVVERSVLANGLRILTEHVPGARSVTLGFWVPIGSRDERTGTDGGITAGSTHFLEHLLFKGTSNRSALDIAIAFDAVGGEHNAVTAKEYTCYYAKVRDLDVPMAVDVMVDMLANSLLSEVEFETERGVILDELAMGEDDPNTVCAEGLFARLFAGSALARPIGGTSADILVAARDAVWEHYRSGYSPRQLVVTAAGGVSHGQLRELIEAAVSSTAWADAPDAAPVSRRATMPEGPVRVDGGAHAIARPIEQCTLMLGLPGLAVTDPRRATLSVLNSVLGGGMSSRLFQDIRERRGLAYSVYSSAPSYSDQGAFVLAASCSPANAGEVADRLWEQFLLLADRGVDDQEIARAFGQLSGSAALALEDSDTRMTRLGRAELMTGEFLDLDATLARLAKVDRAQLAELATEIAAGTPVLTAVGAVGDDFARDRACSTSDRATTGAGHR
ncbi:M16 family metallopeptidase [Mycetocola reblochoni]|uniref:Peptidase, M16 family n=2 Tax=Mycetocola reblochoni TaxID=331618 RepID=A0A1R4K9G4_9MICO|nr:pitrilysin family protein [Mycetocola reblochoni]RLP68102.1 insulinase family protein [Mycetocola reblochoni]SJN40792.1 peptidase, M16 family [Mycetocola reblochoni REB411]